VEGWLKSEIGVVALDAYPNDEVVKAGKFAKHKSIRSESINSPKI
jgi:hypothetical protein